MPMAYLRETPSRPFAEGYVKKAVSEGDREQSVCLRIPKQIPLFLLPMVALAVLFIGCSFQFGLWASPDLSEGKEIFAANCAVCHGARGEGQPDWHVRRDDGTLPTPPLNGDGHTWHHGDGLLYRIVSEGGKTLEDPDYPGFRSAMPAFGDRLSPEEIVAVLEYLKHLWGDKTKLGLSIRESQALVSEQDPYPTDAGRY